MSPASSPRRRKAAETPTRVRLYLLGAFHLEREGKPIHFPRRRVQALLAYRALNPQPHPREQLAALFGGDSTDRQARTSLRQGIAILCRHTLRLTPPADTARVDRLGL